LVACLFIPEYPFWVCRQIHPGESMLVLHDGVRVLAVSEPLRAAGLQPGQSLDRASVLVPDALYSLRDSGIEEAMWEDLLYLLHDLSPRLLPLRPGTALLEPWDRAGLRQMARSLQARAGIGQRRFLAMLAAVQAPDTALSEVTPELTRRLYDRSPIVVLGEFGFDEEIIERLRLFGLATLGRLCELTRRHLEAQFGQEGRRLFELLHGGEEEPPVPEFIAPPSVSVSYDFEYPAIEPGEIHPVLDLLIAQAIEKLAGRRARMMTIRLAVRGRDGGLRMLRRLLKEPVSGRLPLRVVAETLLRPLLGDAVEIDRIAVELGALVEPRVEQGGLFAERPAVFDAVRTIHHRFPGTLVRAVVDDPDPVRPEEGIRYEPYPDAVAPGRRRR
jgi:hypothetical protein